MPTISFPSVSSGLSSDQLADIVARLTKEVQWLLNGNIDSLNIKKLTADLIVAGTILTNKVTIRAELDSGAYITIDSNGMTVYDGTQNSLRIDLNGNITMIGTLNASQINGSVITGSLIQTDAAGLYPRVELSSSDRLLGAYGDADKYVSISPAESGEPAVVFTDVSTKAVITYIPGSYFLVGSSLGVPMSLTSGNNLVISATNTLQLSGSSLTINGNSGFTGSFSTGSQTVFVEKGLITAVI